MEAVKIVEQRKNLPYPSHWRVAFNQREREGMRHIGFVPIAEFFSSKGDERVRLVPGIPLRRVDGVIFYVQDVVETTELGAWLALAATDPHVGTVPQVDDELEIL